MAAADQAGQLREQADALEKEAKLEAKLLEAKDAYRHSRGDEKAKQRLHKAKADIIEARQARRSAGVTVGGDAVATNGNEG